MFLISNCHTSQALIRALKSSQSSFRNVIQSPLNMSPMHTVSSSYLKMRSDHNTHDKSKITNSVIRISPVNNQHQFRLYSTSSPNNADDDKASVKDKIKKLWKTYGYVAVGSYLSIYIITLSSLFFALDFDIFHASTFGFRPEDAVHKVFNNLISISFYYICIL